MHRFRLPWCLALLALPFAAPAAPLERMVVLQVKPVDEASKKSAEVLTEVLLTDISRLRRFEVLGQTDLDALLSFERQKDLAGCGDASSSCLAELAGGLGARYLFVSSLGRVGGQLRLDMKVLDAAHAKVLSREGSVVERDDQLVATAQRLLAEVMAAVPGSPPSPGASVSSSSGGPPRFTALSWGLMGGGVVVAGAGVLLGQAALSFNTDKASMTFDQASRAREAAVLQQTAGAVALGVGAVAIAVGAGLFVVDRLSGPRLTSVTVAPLAQGWALACTGAF